MCSFKILKYKFFKFKFKMKKTSWQHPYVDVFRHFKLQSFKNSGKKGNVKDIQVGYI